MRLYEHGLRQQQPKMQFISIPNHVTNPILGSPNLTCGYGGHGYNNNN